MALLKWVILNDQPFTEPQQEAFVELIHTLNPNAETISDKTVRADVMAAYEEKLNNLKAMVAEIPGKISITMDGWSSKNSLSFLGIRGHWLDKDWYYCSKLFDFAYIEDGHSGYYQSKILNECLSRLGIPFTKILAITVDNASNNDTLFDWLNEISQDSSRVRCLAHIINLAVQDMLATLKIPDADDVEDEFILDDEVSFNSAFYHRISG